MCGWCNFDLEPTWAEYKMRDGEYHIGLEYDAISVSRHVKKFGGNADMVMQLPINFCPMCGRSLAEYKIEGEDDVN